MHHESLEPRRLLAVTTAIGDGVLTVNGTPDDDYIQIRVEDGKVRVDVEFDPPAYFTRVRSIVVNAGDGMDTVWLFPSVQVPSRLYGGADDDRLWGGSGPDVIHGGDGDDFIEGNLGNDAIFGGNGNDTIGMGIPEGAVESEHADYIEGQSGKDAVSFSRVNRSVYGEIVVSKSGENIYYSGKAGNDRTFAHFRTIEGLYGSDAADDLRLVIKPGSWDATQESNRVSVTLNGSDGDDKISTASGSTWQVNRSVLIGGEGNDAFGYANGWGQISIYGSEGDDLLRVEGDGNFSLFDGGPGKDTQVFGYMGGNAFLGSKQLAPNVENALIYYAKVNESFVGNDLDNYIEVRAPIRAVYGQGGNDKIVIAPYGDDSSPSIFGGAGNDRITGDPTDVRRLKLYGDSGRDVIYGGGGSDYIYGGDDNDALFGRDGYDQMDGGAGDDYLEGNTGIDYLFGGTGDDTFYTRDRRTDYITGGDGVDRLQGDSLEKLWDTVESVTLS